jgi:tellurite resistance protein TerC
MVRLVRRVLPVTDGYRGERLLVREAGVLMATPLFLCLVFIEVSDVVFAIDSVPAIFALTSEPLVVFTSNILAILGLRSMYFLLAGVMDRFHLLKYGLSAILVFVGLKMAWLNSAFGGKFPIAWSLGIIFGILAVSVVLSLLIRPRAVAGATAPAAPRGGAVS